MTRPEEERCNESEGIPVTREVSQGETKDVQESSDKGETDVDEVVGKIIKNMQSYYIEFQLIFFR